jgi:hypothetical protein
VEQEPSKPDGEKVNLKCELAGTGLLHPTLKSELELFTAGCRDLNSKVF